MTAHEYRNQGLLWGKIQTTLKIIHRNWRVIMDLVSTIHISLVDGLNRGKERKRQLTIWAIAQHVQQGLHIALMENPTRKWRARGFRPKIIWEDVTTRTSVVRLSKKKASEKMMEISLLMVWLCLTSSWWGLRTDLWSRLWLTYEVPIIFSWLQNELSRLQQLWYTVELRRIYVLWVSRGQEMSNKIFFFRSV